MKELLGFVAVMAGLFFGVGEFKGWTLGLPSQMPVMVYKSDGNVTAERRLTTATQLPFEMTGQVKRGSVTVQAFHQTAGSYQQQKAAGKEQAVFEQTFTKGETINLKEILANGNGNYRIEFKFNDATGVFNVDLPKGSEL